MVPTRTTLCGMQSLTDQTTFWLLSTSLMVQVLLAGRTVHDGMLGWVPTTALLAPHAINCWLVGQNSFVP